MSYSSQKSTKEQSIQYLNRSIAALHCFLLRCDVCFVPLLYYGCVTVSQTEYDDPMWYLLWWMRCNVLRWISLLQAVFLFCSAVLYFTGVFQHVLVASSGVVMRPFIALHSILFRQVVILSFTFFDVMGDCYEDKMKATAFPPLPCRLPLLWIRK